MQHSTPALGTRFQKSKVLQGFAALFYFSLTQTIR